MTLAIQTQNQTITAWDIIPRLARYQMLPQLIAESIIDEAIENIECSPEETANACQQFYQQNQLFTELQRQTWAERHGMTQADIEELATRKLRIQKFKESNWGNGLDIYFLQRKPQLDKVIFSMIQVPDMGMAQEIYFRLQEGEQSFAELAQQYSQGPQAETEGKIGPVECSTLPLPLVNLIHSHQSGDLLPPFPMGNTAVVIRLEKLIQAELDDLTRQRLINEKFQAWLKSQIKEQNYQVNNFLN